MNRIEAYGSRVREECYDVFAETHTPREFVGSFSLCVVNTILPTFGTGLLVFVAIVSVNDRVSNLALFATVVVFTPVVNEDLRGEFRARCGCTGTPQGKASVTTLSFRGGPKIATRLLIGNLILAVLAVPVSYVVVHRLAVRNRSTVIAATMDEALEIIAEDLLEP